MTRKEIVKRIEEVEAQIMYEECADKNYKFNVVANLKATLNTLNEELKKMAK